MTPLRRGVWVGVFALAIAGGCNIPSLPFFLMGGESKVEAKWHRLATDDKDTKIKVAILASNNLEVREHLAKIDLDMSKAVVYHLKTLCEYNKENVEVVSVNKIEAYKQHHPEWNDGPLDLPKIGKDLKVKYLIYLELNKLTLYEPGTRQLYQGETELEITLIDVPKGADDIPDKKEFHERYPSTPIDTSDEPNPNAFRNRFVSHIAERIAWEFTAHPTEKDYGGN